MADAKRGRLRSVNIRPMYDEKGKVTGHTVSAEHEPMGKGNEYKYMPPVETPHESVPSAMAKATDHVEKNCEDCGYAKQAGRGMKEAIGVR